MSAIANGMKKRLSIVAARIKTVDDGLSVEYTAAKKRFLREKHALEDAMRMTDDAVAVWTAVAAAQERLAEIAEGELAMDSALHEAAAAALSATRAAQANILEPAPTSDSAAKLLGIVRAHVAVLDAIEKEFKGVETQFTQTQRYEKKVNRMAAKDTKTEKARRNLEKLESSRAAFNSALDALVARMDRESSKYEAVFQCVQTAFWLRHDALLNAVTDGSSKARKEALEVAEKLVKIDLSNEEVTVVSSDEANDNAPQQVPEEKADKAEAKPAEEEKADKSEEKADKAEAKPAETQVDAVSEITAA